MGDLHELFDLNRIGSIFTFVAFLGPIAGVLIGGLIGARNKKLKRSMIFGLLWGLIGPLNWLLWRIYNAITDRNGLDTVKNLAINLALFVFVGLVIGLVAARLQIRKSVFSASSNEEVENTPQSA